MEIDIDFETARVIKVFLVLAFTFGVVYLASKSNQPIGEYMINLFLRIDGLLYEYNFTNIPDAIACKRYWERIGIKVSITI